MSQSVVRRGHPAPDWSAGPLALRWRSWPGVLRRSVVGCYKDNLFDWAAALTYYSAISLFPGLLVATALLGLAGPSAAQSLIDTIQQFGPNDGSELMVNAIGELQGNRAVAGPLALAGVAAALWSASGYIGAFVRASNVVYRTTEGRPIWKTVPMQIGLTAALVVVVSVCAIGVVLTGRAADVVGHWLGFGSVGVQIWDIAKWPVLALLVSLAVALLYWAAPNARQPGFAWLTPGSLLAVVLWIGASAGLAFYVGHFDSYNRVYGSLAGAIVFLVWLWLTNLSILLGAEFDAELARGRRIEQGCPPGLEPILPHREVPDDEPVVHAPCEHAVAPAAGR
ncbi:YihY/virulence factor BrkB family protein [Nocardia sp. NPDC003345]